MNKIEIPDDQYYLGCNAKNLVRLTFLEKCSYFNRKYQLIRLIFAYSTFENIEILSDQGVVQSEPNWHHRLPVLLRLYCKKNPPPNFPGKIVRISIRNIDLFAYYLLNIFFQKKRIFIGLKIWSNQYKLKTKRILAVACLGENLVFHTEICEFRD